MGVLKNFITRSMLTTLTIVIGFYVLVCGLFYFQQENLVYQASAFTRHVERTPTHKGLIFDDLTLLTADNVQLHAWYIPAESARATVIYCHGNASNISHWLENIALFNALKLNVLIFDYRGFGRSQGEHTEQGTYLDADAVWGYLQNRAEIKSLPMIVYGRSLGGGIASYIAERYPVSMLILEATYTSIPAIGNDKFPWLPVHWLAKLEYDTLQRLDRITVPILVAHSPHDEVIPYHHGEALFVRAKPPKQFIRMAGGHNAGFDLSPAFRDALQGFIAQHL